MTACGTNPPPEPLTKIVYPAMPDTTCPREPVAPVMANDVEFAKYLKAKDDAGASCRDRLDAVDATVKAWPK